MTGGRCRPAGDCRTGGLGRTRGQAAEGDGIALYGTSSGAILAALAHTLPYDALVSAGGSFPADRLGTITTPTLAVDSTGSPQWLCDASRATAEAIPGGRSISLDGGHHEVPPATLAPALREFLLG
ncbi:hypothetical protein OOJ91_19905 [Micromonospora lupini]|uniref:alpha/beta fold hydrolase n=1 Tax=Micromonospora lupini TaxID=285679 RepID=UPI00225B7C10|nr:hypothetical protein [Micromonospora lupini]MCX5068111.1 hypothetical protein [Micromonospora lupini]